MRTRLLLTPAVLLIAFTSTTALAQMQYPLPDDVDSPEGIVNAAYAALQRAPGAEFQWDRVRSLFIPQANLIPNTEQTGGEFRVLSLEDFIKWIDGATPIGGTNDKGFTEEAIHNRVEHYGDIAHVFSTYQKHFWEDDQILGRGINTFQLVYNADRWWITGIVWDEENGAGPIPDTYLPKN
jgi:hypothetical protein